MLAYAKEEKQFQTRDWSVFPRSTFLQVQYYLTKQRTILELERSHFDKIKLPLQKKQAELETLCRQHNAKKKIEEIATSIFRKNLRFVRQLDEVESHFKQVIQCLNHTEEQMKALENRIACDKVNTRYRVMVSDTLSNNKAASLIADAILFAPQAVQLVARFDGDNLEMDKDWELMRECDKDEIIRKKIIRELSLSVKVAIFSLLDNFLPILTLFEEDIGFYFGQIVTAITIHCAHINSE